MEQTGPPLSSPVTSEGTSSRSRGAAHSWGYGLTCCRCLALSRVQLFATPQTVAHHGPLSMGFLSQEHWSGLPFPAPGDLPDPGIEPKSPASPSLQVDSLPTEPLGKPYTDTCKVFCSVWHMENISYYWHYYFSLSH